MNKLPAFINEKKLLQLIQQWLQEDIGKGDYTTQACVPNDSTKTAKLLVKENGLIAGVYLAQKIVEVVDKNCKLTIYKKDGSLVKKGDVVFVVKGKASSILKAERVLLNCMQRMSGIATKTDFLKQLCKNTSVKLLDTRKTSPGLRIIEKWAVLLGGGNNHRFGLDDMMMIKDNHIDYAGGIKPAIEKCNAFLKNNKLKIKIEIEARNLKELKEILTLGGIHRIMLDNFSITDLKKAVELINKKYETEASGNITEKTIAQYARCGVDFISVGALTHSVKSLDLSLKATV